MIVVLYFKGNPGDPDKWGYFLIAHTTQILTFTLQILFHFYRLAHVSLCTPPDHCVLLCSFESLLNATIYWLSLVHHRPKQNTAPLQPWLVLEMNGQVHAWHCTCMAGLVEAYSHIATVLFYLVTSWVKIRQTSCTSQRCPWLMPGQGMKHKE